MARSIGYHSFFNILKRFWNLTFLYSGHNSWCQEKEVAPVPVMGKESQSCLSHGAYNWELCLWRCKIMSMTDSNFIGTQDKALWNWLQLPTYLAQQLQYIRQNVRNNSLRSLSNVTGLIAVAQGTSLSSIRQISTGDITGWNNSNRMIGSKSEKSYIIGRQQSRPKCHNCRSMHI